MKRKGLKIAVITGAVVAVSAIVLVIVMIFRRYSLPYDGTVSSLEETLPLSQVLTAEQAAEDFDYIYSTIKEKHPCFLDGSDLPEKLTAAYEKGKAELSLKETVTVEELWRCAAEMCHALGDGHTLVMPAGDRYINDLTEIRGSTVTHIDGISCEALLADFKSFFSYEPQVDFYADHTFYSTVMLRESWLDLLGADVSDGADFTVETADGVIERHFEFVPAEEVKGLGATGETCSYVIDRENSIGIFTLNECTVNEEYLTELEAFFSEIKESGIDNIAVDLRENGGGNTDVIAEFLKYTGVDSYLLFGGCDIRYGDSLDSFRGEIHKNTPVDEPFDGNIYALTSNSTFSSAMDFAVVISDNKIGKVIGEIPGNMPAAYGDKLSFQCPNSKLLLSVSYKKFHRVDNTKSDEPLIPDYETDSDKAVEMLYELIG